MQLLVIWVLQVLQVFFVLPMVSLKDVLLSQLVYDLRLKLSLWLQFMLFCLLGRKIGMFLLVGNKFILFSYSPTKLVFSYFLALASNLDSLFGVYF